MNSLVDFQSSGTIFGTLNPVLGGAKKKWPIYFFFISQYRKKINDTFFSIFFLKVGSPYFFDFLKKIEKTQKLRMTRR